MSQSILSKSVFILLNPLSLIILWKPRIVLLFLIYVLLSLLRFRLVKMFSHLLHIYYNKFFIKNQVIFQTIFFFSFFMYILYQNFLKKSIKLRKTQFEYLILLSKLFILHSKSIHNTKRAMYHYMTLFITY